MDNKELEKQLWENGLDHITMQVKASVIELARNVQETIKARSEKSFFETALEDIDNGWGKAGTKLGHDKRAAWERESRPFECIEWDWAPKKNQKAWYWDIEGRLSEYTGQKTWVDTFGRSFPTKEMAERWKAEMDNTVPHDNISGHELTKDWSTATLEDVPVDWMPKDGQKYWVVRGSKLDGPYMRNGEWIIGIKSPMRLFPTERLCQMYLDSLKPVEQTPDFSKIAMGPILESDMDAFSDYLENIGIGKFEGWAESEMIAHFRHTKTSPLYFLVDGKTPMFVQQEYYMVQQREKVPFVQAKPVERWKPEVGEKFWWTTPNGTVHSFIWSGNGHDRACFDFGNCFRTESDALAARERVKKALLNT